MTAGRRARSYLTHIALTSHNSRALRSKRPLSPVRDPDERQSSSPPTRWLLSSGGQLPIFRFSSSPSKCKTIIPKPGKSCLTVFTSSRLITAQVLSEKLCLTAYSLHRTSYILHPIITQKQSLPGTPPRFIVSSCTLAQPGFFSTRCFLMLPHCAQSPLILRHHQTPITPFLTLPLPFSAARLPYS